MQTRGDGMSRQTLARAAAAACVAQTARYRAAHDALSRVHQELVAEAARLAERIEERLSPRRTQ